MDSAPRPKGPSNLPPVLGRPMGLPMVILLILGAVALATVLTGNAATGRDAISYDEFVTQVKGGNVTRIVLSGDHLEGEFAKELPETLPGRKPQKTFSLDLNPYLREGFDRLMQEHDDIKKLTRTPTDGTGFLMGLYMLVPLLLMAGFWMTLRRARDPLGNTGFLGGFSKSPAKRYDAKDKQVTFADVAGLEQVKADLQEIVEFLKDPQKFQRLGGRVPKGVLLMGPPGTGKTLLARAVAGEAGVPFFSISGSEFIQMREQTLNQILSEMDGFSPSESVIVLAATNRPDVLDPALLRPGRFDRHVTVDRPNQKARLALFKVHTRTVPLALDVDLDRLAGATVGLTGADIRNLVNEAALWATRHDKNAVDSSDFDYARDKVLMGPKREEVLTGREKKMTAYHEAGHALAAWLLPGVDKLHKVTIIPRGRALGVTQLVPEEDRMNIGESALMNRLVLGLAGRAAEKIVFGEYTAGAENDLQNATRIARKMVATWGMSERVGPVACSTSNEHPFLGRDVYEHREFSERTAQIIDEEVTRILNEAAERAVKLLSDNRAKLDSLAGALETREMLDDTEVQEIIGPATPRRAGESMPGSDPAPIQAARDSNPA